MDQMSTRDRLKARRLQREREIAQSAKEEDSGDPLEEEDAVAEDLEKDIKKRRRRTQRQLDRTLESREEETEDGTQQMKRAQKRAKQRLREEAARSTADDSDDGERSHVTQDSASVAEEDGGVPMDAATPPETTRSVDDTPRRESRAALHMSDKERMRHKIQMKKLAAREKAKDEVYRDSSRLLAGMRSELRATRFDDQDMSILEDTTIEQELEKSLKSSRWKKAAEKVMDGEGRSEQPTASEGFDFFCKQFEPEPEPAKEGEEAEAGTAEEGEAKEEDESAAPIAEGIGEEEEEEEDGEEPGTSDKKKKKKKGKEDEERLLDDDLEAAEGWKAYHYSRAEYKPKHKRDAEFADATFYPSIIEAPIEKRMTGEQQARYLENEGFYVGVRPPVANKNLHKIENRIIQQGTEGDKRWFGEDGRLVTCADPLKEIPTRPQLAEELPPALQTRYTQAYMREFDSRFINGSVSAQGLYRLDVDVNCVKLQHHHSFSREHVLAERLTELYTQYTSRARRKAAELLTMQLHSLQERAAHVEDVIKKARKHQGSEIHARLHELHADIRITRKSRDAELAADKHLLQHILDAWKGIKALREFQRCTNTSVKLTIIIEASNKAEDEAEWEREVTDEVKEIKRTLQEEHEKAMEVYKKEAEKYKQQKADKKAAAKRQRQRERKRHQRQKRQQRREANADTEGNSSNDDDLEGFDPNDEEQEEKDLKIIEEIELDKPEKPKPVEEADTRESILMKFREIRRLPGASKLTPELSNGSAITKTADCPRGEQDRRNYVDRFRLFCKLLYNNKEVYRTESKPLGQDFVVHFAKIFSIEIAQWPETIKIEIYETGGLLNTLLSEVYLEIPDSNVTTDTNTLEDMEFSSDQKVSHSHEGVGSGIPFSFEASGGNMISLMTTGILTTSAAWGIDRQGNVLVPPSGPTDNQLFSAMKGMDALAGIGMNGMMDMDKLTKWIAESKLDPNQPSNADLMHLMRPAGGGDAALQGLRMPEYFRLEQLQQEFNFCSDREIEDSKRFRLFRLREQEVPEFKNKVIPAYDREVSESMFDEYEKRMKSHEKLKDMDVMESHRVAVAQFRQKVYEQIMIRFRRATRQKSLSDMINEEVLPNITVVLPQLMKYLEPQRPLKVKRQERKRVAPQNLSGPGAVKIIVNIERAIHVPIRTEALHPAASGMALAGVGSNLTGQPSLMSARGAMSATSAGGMWQGAAGGGGPGGMGGPDGGPVKNIAGETLVRPFIQVMFQRNTAQTSVADGPNPCWNEDLQLPFRAPQGDYSPNNLQSCNDMLYLNLFDEHIVDMPVTDQDRGTNIHRRIEQEYLGSFKIPFSTIYHRSSINGTFRLHKPPVLLGYSPGQHQSNHDIHDVAAASEDDHTFVRLFVTIEPPLAIPDSMPEKFESNEDDTLMQFAEMWQYQLQTKFPQRNYKTTVVDINAKSVFLTRYMKALKPPEELLEAENPTKLAEKVARFVSLIPFVSDNVVFPGICDIWSTCDQFLMMLQGDEEEHAVMLANFFMHLGKPTYLLIGEAIPEGETAYVLTKEDNSTMKLWNPSTGESFSSRSNYCPVVRVDCVANADNIWANIQPNEKPSRMNFDFSNTKHWQPFFDRNNPALGLSSVQPEALIYKPTDKQFVLDLQEKIERKLRDKIMSWRTNSVTRWNRLCMRAFRSLLEKLEDNHGQEAQAEHAAELEQVLGSYKLCGFPINMPYTEMTPLIDAVFATGVQNKEANGIEFAVAVHIHPYPCNVLSVWIYVASLVNKR